jgi:DNA-binding transcriptional ArsR family regulator
MQRAQSTLDAIVSPSVRVACASAEFFGLMPSPSIGAHRPRRRVPAALQRALKRLHRRIERPMNRARNGRHLRCPPAAWRSQPKSDRSTRVKMVRALIETPLAASDLARVVGRSAAATSQRIRVLREVGAVTACGAGM